jgi:hypothetical protein
MHEVAPAAAFSPQSGSAEVCTTSVGNGNSPKWGSGVRMRRQTDDNCSQHSRHRSASRGLSWAGGHAAGSSFGPTRRRYLGRCDRCRLNAARRLRSASGCESCGNQSSEAMKYTRGKCGLDSGSIGRFCRPDLQLLPDTREKLNQPHSLRIVLPQNRKVVTRSSGFVAKPIE